MSALEATHGCYGLIHLCLLSHFLTRKVERPGEPKQRAQVMPTEMSTIASRRREDLGVVGATLVLMVASLTSLRVSFVANMRPCSETDSALSAMPPRFNKLTASISMRLTRGRIVSFPERTQLWDLGGEAAANGHPDFSPTPTLGETLVTPLICVSAAT